MRKEQIARKGIAESITFILSLLVLFFLSTESTHAQEYTPLVGLPQVDGQNQGLAAYFNRLYMVTIAVGAILAFIKISIAGVKWSLSDIVTDKSDAKNDIKGALFGLAILLIPFIVLNTIYPGLTSLNILQNATSVRITPPPPPGPTNLDTTGGTAGNGRTIADICDVRPGVLPPQGCAVGAMTPAEQQAAAACTARQGTYSVPTRTCIERACTTLPQIQMTMARQVSIESQCRSSGGTPQPLEEAPGSGGSQVRICCTR
jgi:hypothetical protein